MSRSEDKIRRRIAENPVIISMEGVPGNAEYGFSAKGGGDAEGHG